MGFFIFPMFLDHAGIPDSDRHPMLLSLPRTIRHGDNPSGGKQRFPGALIIPAPERTTVRPPTTQ